MSAASARPVAIAGAMTAETLDPCPGGASPVIASSDPQEPEGRAGDAPGAITNFEKMVPRAFTLVVVVLARDHPGASPSGLVHIHDNAGLLSEFWLSRSHQRKRPEP
jgi:hypothetical protein